MARPNSAPQLGDQLDDIVRERAQRNEAARGDQPQFCVKHRAAAAARQQLSEARAAHGRPQQRRNQRRVHFVVLR
jgi:hypothetical protein